MSSPKRSALIYSLDLSMVHACMWPQDRAATRWSDHAACLPVGNWCASAQQSRLLLSTGKRLNGAVWVHDRLHAALGFLTGRRFAEMTFTGPKHHMPEFSRQVFCRLVSSHSQPRIFPRDLTSRLVDRACAVSSGYRVYTIYSIGLRFMAILGLPVGVFFWCSTVSICDIYESTVQLGWRGVLLPALLAP